MRIGYDAKRIFHNRTGLGNYGRDIIRVLTANTAIKHFFLFNTKKSRLGHLVEMERSQIVFPETLLWRAFPTLWRVLGQGRRIKKLNLDLYHGLSGEIPVDIRKIKVPRIVTIHDLIFLSHPHFYNLWDRIIYKFKLRYAVVFADHIVAISQQTKWDIMKFFKVPSEKISVVYQGCNDAFKTAYTSEELEATRNKFGLPDHYVLNVGTIQERKNALSLVKAINGTPYHLVLVGGKKGYARKVEAYIRSNGLEGQVTLLTNINTRELAMTYQNASMLCYPSTCEGFGIPIIEALYSKIPVIVTKGGCFPEAAGPDSLYIEPYDIIEIREKIHWLFSHPEERKILARKGYEYVQRFSDENVAQNLLKIYKSLV